MNRSAIFWKSCCWNRLLQQAADSSEYSFQNQRLHEFLTWMLGPHLARQVFPLSQGPHVDTTKPRVVTYEHCKSAANWRPTEFRYLERNFTRMGPKKMAKSVDPQPVSEAKTASRKVSVFSGVSHFLRPIINYCCSFQAVRGSEASQESGKQSSQKIGSKSQNSIYTVVSIAVISVVAWFAYQGIFICWKWF